MLGIVSVALFLISIDGSVLFTALPVLSKDLGATAGQQLWILNAYTVVMSGLLLGAGTLGDKLGHRRMFLFGMAVFGVASLACALAYSPGTLIAARVLLAVGAAPMMPATLALIRLTFTDARQRNTAIAVWSMVSVVGAVVGPVVGGLLLEHFHWGSVFLVNVPLIVAAIALGAAVIPRDEPDRSRPWDAVSSLLATVALAAGVLAVEEAARVPPSWAKVAAGLAIAAVLGAAFVRRQRRLDDPLLPLDVFAIPRFTAGVVAAVVTLVAVSGLGLVVAQRFQLVAGYSPFQAGLLLVVLAVGALPSSLVGGMLLNRIGERAPIVWGFAVGALGSTGAPPTPPRAPPSPCWASIRPGGSSPGSSSRGSAWGRLPPSRPRRSSRAFRPLGPAWRLPWKKSPTNSATFWPPPSSAAGSSSSTAWPSTFPQGPPPGPPRA